MFEKRIKLKQKIKHQANIIGNQMRQIIELNTRLNKELANNRKLKTDNERLIKENNDLSIMLSVREKELLKWRTKEVR